ncbi:MAG: TetR/AcrR family transcriptional regulator [Deltaproteobacteria bacterium]|nr:TetR/AcrR family transcriptional regulator [Deltaproteobacteria bacterium]
MTAANRRQIQKEETRKIIQETAYSLFEKNGYEETTMRELAKQAGVGVGTIFTHFPDKSSLLAGAFLNDLNEIIGKAFVSLPENNIIQQLDHIVSAIYGFYAERPNFSRILIRELFFLQGPYGQNLEKQLFTFLMQIGQLFQKAKDNKEISENIDIEQCVHAFGAFYFHSLHSGLRESTFNIDIQVKLFSSLMEHFLSEKKETNNGAN